MRPIGCSPNVNHAPRCIPEDACVQMELLGHNFFVFLNAETEEVNVVYKRKGNTYGLIEPDFSDED